MDRQIIVIFGGSGDLAKRKLMPALYNLYKSKNLKGDISILGVGRTHFTDTSYRDHITSEWDDRDEKFNKSIFYLSIDPSNHTEYKLLKERLEQFGPAGYLFYLATPPSLYETIPVNLREVGLNREVTDKSTGEVYSRRIIIEKPFGYNLSSALKMNETLNRVFDENQIFRIDHYLGKETVQNILALRFANSILEPIWNRHYIDRVEITAVENMGIGNRGGFYDQVGALRDMAQNHLSQLLALVAMEPPVTFNQKEFRDEVVKVYKSLKPMGKEEIENTVVRGQYIESEKKGVKVNGYRQEQGVPSDSHTETFLAMKINISNWRWEGVPFYLRTGKQMPTKVTEIVVHFKATPHRLFSCREDSPEQNQLIIRIQPNEGMVLKLDMKIPGSGFSVKQFPMEFTYDKLAGYSTDDAYSRLIEDCLNGDVTLFTRNDAVEWSWKYFDAILEHWEENPKTPLYGYPAGSWGPLESDRIVKGGKWTNPCKNLTNTDIYCEL
ncbi:MAG: glucose-6-phosphate dehydrogenase [Bacteroidetes bacterium GWF2_39_10]|nr:MAG: glucose-6-phosphate dehydrogenase [Bacteroidetes bacterium GWF2_39_10]